MERLLLQWQDGQYLINNIFEKLTIVLINEILTL